MNWQYVYTLKEVSKYERCGYSTIGGDPEGYDDDPRVYIIVEIETNEEIIRCAFTKYTAEYYAQKEFEKLNENIELILVEMGEE